MVQQLSADSHWFGGSLSPKGCSGDWSHPSSLCGRQDVLSYTPHGDLPPSPDPRASVTGQLQPVSFEGTSRAPRHEGRHSSGKSETTAKAKASRPHLLRPQQNESMPLSKRTQALSAVSYRKLSRVLLLLRADAAECCWKT